MRAMFNAQATQDVIARQIRDRVLSLAAPMHALLCALHALCLGCWRLSEGGLKRFKPSLDRCAFDAHQRYECVPCLAVSQVRISVRTVVV
jgi:hypothetical protein